MGTRPLTEKEKAELQKNLDESRKRLAQLNTLIADLEKQLTDGTAWEYEPEAFKQMCREVEESARKDRERGERCEIEHYGRILTFAERQGWVHRPKDLKE